jgi:PTH2 family peptidyl-tRNA hydrolase
MKSKQVIVMRKSFIVDGKKVTPRKGKYIAQGAHASMKAILDAGELVKGVNDWDNWLVTLYKDSAIHDWITNLFTKVVCVVETEEEVVALYNKAKEIGIPCALITDAGLTEFNGVPTITCCAIGPAWDSEVDMITGKLELF